jgi:hypothetical protein
MANYSVFIDESGPFLYNTKGDYVGGWICESDKLRKVWSLAEPILKGIFATMPNEKYCHMKLANHERVGGQRAMDLYVKLITELEPHVLKAFRCPVADMHRLGPQEIWIKTQVSTIVQLLGTYQNDHLDFYVSERTTPVLPYVKGIDTSDPKAKGARMRRIPDKEFNDLINGYNQRLLDYIAKDCASLTGHKDFLLKILKGNRAGIPGVTESSGGFQSIADAFCTGQCSRVYKNMYFWKYSKDKFLELPSTYLSYVARAALRQRLDSCDEGELPEILLDCVFGGADDPSCVPLIKDAVERMDSRGWRSFADLLESRLLRPLTVGDDRYSALFRYESVQRLLDQIGEKACSPQLNWALRRSQQKIQAHYGIELAESPAYKLAFGADGRRLFDSSLSLLENRIETAIDEFQLRCVNPLSSAPHLIDDIEKLSSLYDSIAGLLGEGDRSEYDDIAARLAGCRGQYYALRAGMQENGERALADYEKAQSFFLEDERRCPPGQFRKTISGYLTIIEFFNDKVADMRKWLLCEIGEYYSGPSPLIAKSGVVLTLAPDGLCALFDDPKSLNEKVFLVIHVLQFLCLEAKSSIEFSGQWPAKWPFSAKSQAELSAALCALPAESLKRYPLCNAAKWLGCLLSITGAEKEAALACELLAGLDSPDPDRKDGEAYIDALNRAIGRAFAIGSTGVEAAVGELARWLEKREVASPNTDLHGSLQSRLVVIGGMSAKLQLFELARLLPFYYS